MKNVTVLLLSAVLFLATQSLRAQLTVPSYDREQPFLFCGILPQAEPLTVPFDFINTGGTDLVIDSAMAVGDTVDFHANGIAGSGEYYLNPVMWKYLNGRTLLAGTTLFNSFSFAPRSPGNKQIVITTYYHEGTTAKTTQTTIRFHTADAPGGLGFLALQPDTVFYPDPIPYRVVTFDRTVVTDTLFISDTVDVNDSMRASSTGEQRIDLYSCSPASVIGVETSYDVPEDIFRVYAPTMPVDLSTNSATLVDFVYIVAKAAPAVRTATARFVTADERKLVLHITIYTHFTSGVHATDERGSVRAAKLRTLPNPFSGSTTVHLDIARAEHVRLAVMNTLGEQVALLHDGDLDAGEHALRFDGAGLPAGVYFARLESGGTVLTQRLVLMR